LPRRSALQHILHSVARSDDGGRLEIMATKELRVFSGPVEDRFKIRERIDSYCDAVSRSALDDYLACWTEDGARLGEGGECRGIAELRTHWYGIWQVLSKMAFMAQVGAIEVTGDDARARSYCLEIMQFRGGGTHRLIGTYDDKLRRVDGEWLFCERNYRVFLVEDPTDPKGES
jgi:ketosteroid isomerase-like protein